MARKVGRGGADEGVQLLHVARVAVLVGIEVHRGVDQEVVRQLVRDLLRLLVVITIAPHIDDGGALLVFHCLGECHARQRMDDLHRGSKRDIHIYTSCLQGVRASDRSNPHNDILRILGAIVVEGVTVTLHEGHDIGHSIHESLLAVLAVLRAIELCHRNFGATSNVTCAVVLICKGVGDLGECGCKTLAVAATLRVITLCRLHFYVVLEDDSLVVLLQVIQGLLVYRHNSRPLWMRVPSTYPTKERERMSRKSEIIFDSAAILTK